MTGGTAWPALPALVVVFETGASRPWSRIRLQEDSIEGIYETLKQCAASFA